MRVHQLSVFLENRSGRLTEVTEALGLAGINITAQCVADSSDYGVLRMVVSDPGRAETLLKARGLSVTLTDVVCLETPNVPGSLHRALALLSTAGVSVDYMYAFAAGDKAFVLVRTGDIERTISVLIAGKQKLLGDHELGMNYGVRVASSEK
jgi:hypothetical protein